jgi:PIN domain nuclease of toxin-antitoxin system
VRLLLDTHAFLWFITADPLLSTAAKALIADPDNEVLVSPASYWEIAIKVSIGKYPLSVPYETFITKGIDGNGFKVLPIEPKHTAMLTAMPFHHRDPFDRLLVAQAQAEKIPLVSADAILDQYGITRLW